MRKLGKYSLGIGDRFGHQARSQLKAIIQADNLGYDLIPVWNKSDREHSIINTVQSSTRKAADEAVKALNWNKPYFVDADHINQTNVGRFLEASDFFTIDVADFIGKPVDKELMQDFINRHIKYIGTIKLDSIHKEYNIREETIRQACEKYLAAMEEAGKIYRIIEQGKGKENIVIEVSIDEADSPQTPVELLFILAMATHWCIPVQTIAPKFTGYFYKGVDYVGDVVQFFNELEEDLAIIHFAIKEFGLPDNLKLSIHSGSDKFSLYEHIKRLIKKHDAGLHLKTAGTTWLEELIGLSESGEQGLSLAKSIYRQSYNNLEELTAPYLTVINIDENSLPKPDEVDQWDSQIFSNTLRHDKKNKYYNPDLRQLLHVGYKIAAKMGEDYLSALRQHQETIERNVIENLLERHIKKVFPRTG